VSEHYVRAYRFVDTATGHVFLEPTFEREVDALGHLAYEPDAHPGVLHVEVVAPPLSPIEVRARDFAVERHGEQKYGGKPYVVHLEAVRQVMCDLGFTGDDDELVASWVHDTEEDTKTTREEIRERFGSRVERLVWSVSGFGRNRKERKKDAFDKMRALDAADAESAVNLKLGDRIANTESCLRNRERSLAQMYRSEMPEFEAALAGRGLPRAWSRLRRTIFALSRV
jgi:guanosine-3',5'-bis(diphosphate) 3'-pyrophosphohydrolase